METSAMENSKQRPDVNLTFSDVRYAVQVKKETKEILRGVTGAIRGGKMMCILGPSGSGKTSLIHIIARKLANSKSKEITGAVRCNGVDLTPSQFQKISGLVTQEDVFNEALTVAETLRFMAKLKFVSGHQERIDKVVKKLQLDSCLKTYVGDDSNPYLKGISGGEKRRLAIALEILDEDISFLVLDEPTSGLDAAAALNVANILRNLADTNIAVVTTLHQPRSSIVANFEDLMVLAAGRTVYYGSLEQFIPYIQTDLRCQLPNNENPYDFLLDALNSLIRKQSSITMGVIPEECEDASDTLADVFQNSGLKRTMEEKLSQVQDSTNILDVVKNSKRSIGWCSKCCTLYHRTFLVKMRDPMVLMTQLSTAIMIGLMFGVIYWQCYEKSLEYVILDTQMAIVMCTMMSVWLPYDVTLTFPRERQIFLRERKAGLYQSACFYVARISADMPFHILASGLMACIVYPMSGLRMGVHIFALMNILGVLVGASVMQMIGAVSKTFEEANMLMMLILMLAMLMSSGFIREVPSFLLWMREVSIMGLVGDLAMYFEFKDVDPLYGTPEDVYKAYGVRIRSDDDMNLAIFILLTIYVICRILCFLAVKFMHTGRSCGENFAD
jgi:ABC-type multidrug transport system ATPase subunit